MSSAGDKQQFGPSGLLYGSRRGGRFDKSLSHRSDPIGFGPGLVEWLRLSDGARHRIDGPAVQIEKGGELVMPCHHPEQHSDGCTTVHGPAGLYYRGGIWGSREQPGLIIEAGGRWEDFLWDIEIDGPATLWYVNGQLDRTNGPAVQSGKVEYWFREGRPHRDGGPASVEEDGTRRWYWDGSLHRSDGPAVEYPDGRREWWSRDLLHREDGPAAVLPSSVREWFPDMLNFDSTGWMPRSNGDQGRWFIEGPAEIWIRDGRFHRDDGPAVKGPNRRREFWLKGERLSELDFAGRRT